MSCCRGWVCTLAADWGLPEERCRKDTTREPASQPGRTGAGLILIAFVGFSVAGLAAAL